MNPALEFIRKLEPSNRVALFSNHWTCMGILQGLSDNAKHSILRAVSFGPGVDISFANMRTWFVEPTLFSEMMTELNEWNILENSKLNTNFRECIADFIVSKVSHTYGASDEYESISTEELSEYARSTWELLLLELINIDENSRGRRNKNRRVLLAEAELVDDGSCTLQGYEFLLEDTNLQVWKFLEMLLNRTTDEDRNALINFIMTLGFLEIGSPYYLERLSENQRELLSRFELMGFVLVKGDIFYPTPLVRSLLHEDGYDLSSSGVSQADQSGSKQDGGITVETNFRVYGYDCSKLTRKILSWFVRIEAVLPNMLVGQLEREKVVETFKSKHLTADQLLRFLRVRAHPLWPLPPSVIRRLISWESGHRRWEAKTAVMLDITPVMGNRMKAFKDRILGEQIPVLWFNPKVPRIVLAPDAVPYVEKILMDVSRFER
eukprot:TRINITY_DN779848_c0_g1_i1.p1 TRINITY_DN779848_c0_g1~~TRINITY_DN779848_c0_g1_i1.p1  ORF type:complete len:436 (+),score=98.76 TRINITY_DN779848_c0_g1_i1:64-1371(+)